MNLFEEYKKNILKNKEFSINEYKEIVKKVENSPAKYKGEVINFLFQPFFFSKEESNYFESIIEDFSKILNKVIDEYIKNPNFRNEFGFSKEIEELILVDPGYRNNFPIGRFDIFYNGIGDFKFCELNLDGSSGMVESRELDNIILSSQIMKDIKRKYDIISKELFDTWVDEFMINFNEFYKNDKSITDNPQIAIVDFFDNIPEEFLEFKKSFENKGIKTIIVKPDLLEYNNNKLYYKDFHIHGIYRRLVTSDLERNIDKLDDLINAYKDNNVCLIGPIRSQVLHNKVLFEVLSSEENLSFLDSREIDFLKKHIPITKRIKSKKDIEYVLKNKNKLIIKPLDLYACKGVYVGKDYDFKKWEYILNNLEGEYIHQEYCKVPNREMLIIKDGEIHFEDFNFILGLFQYNNNFKGLFNRVGRKNIIGSLVECFTIPNYIADI